MTQLCSGFSLLSNDDIHDLTHPLTGYISRHLPSHTHKKKKTLVLDVDETILSAMPWYNEIITGDIVQEIDDHGSLWVVTALFVSYIPPGSSSPQIAVVRSQTETDLIFSSSSSESAYVRAVELTDSYCIRSITMDVNAISNRFEPCFDSFEQLHSYNLRRPNVAPVSFYCKGLIVRLRPHLPAFLSEVCLSYDVTLFTAAAKDTYSTLLRYAERSLSPVLGGMSLWKNVLYRADCDFVLNETSYYHKDIKKLGADLSQVVIVDDKWESFLGYEPNAIRVEKFYGSPNDDQLPRLLKLLRIVKDADDVRYPLCFLNEKVRRRSEDEDLVSTLGRTMEFLADLKKKYCSPTETETMSSSSFNLRDLLQKEQTQKVETYL